jgi:hypothetical protein
MAEQVRDKTHSRIRCIAHAEVAAAEVNFSPGERVCFLGESAMFTFLLWCILFVLCWPLALLALVLYPVVWLLLLPFRIVGIAVEGALKLVWAVVTLPARLLSAPGRL